MPSEFNDENVSSCYSQCEGYTQHKPEVVDYCEPFPDFFAPDSESACSKEKVLKK